MHLKVCHRSFSNNVSTYDAVSSVSEACGTILIPPLIDVSLLIKLFSLVIKPVSDLMTNHHTNTTKVQ